MEEATFGKVVNYCLVCQLFPSTFTKTVVLAENGPLLGQLHSLPLLLRPDDVGRRN